MVLLLELVETPPEVYSYQLLATSRTGTLQKEIGEELMETEAPAQ